MEEVALQHPAIMMGGLSRLTQQVVGEHQIDLQDLPQELRQEDAGDQQRRQGRVFCPDRWNPCGSHRGCEKGTKSFTRSRSATTEFQFAQAYGYPRCRASDHCFASLGDCLAFWVGELQNFVDRRRACCVLQVSLRRPCQLPNVVFLYCFWVCGCVVQLIGVSLFQSSLSKHSYLEGWHLFFPLDFEQFCGQRVAKFCPQHVILL